MSFDFNTAEPQRQGVGELIPDNTVAHAIITLRPGKFGPGGWLTATKDGSGLFADMELTITSGPYERRKIWAKYMVEGDTDGHKKAVAISRTAMRAMLESARGIDPSDENEVAIKGRFVEGWGAFDGLEVCIKIGIEQPKDKNDGSGDKWPAKNRLKVVLTPADRDYIRPNPSNVAPAATAQRSVGAPSASAPAVTKPKWAS